MSRRCSLVLAAAIALLRPLPAAAQSLPAAECGSAVHPAFTGVRAGDRVAEFLPGDGCVTQVLARRVGDAGRVYRVSVIADDLAAVGGNVFAIHLKARLHAAPDLWSSSEDPGGAYGYWAASPPAENFAAPEPLDLIWAAALDESSLGPVDLRMVGSAMLAALKPGGLLLIGDGRSMQLRQALLAAGFEPVMDRRSSSLKYRRP